MSNFLIGLFTLTGTLSGIWLKDYLEHKNSRLNSLKQKAIATYILCNHLRKTLIVQQVICKGLIENPDFDYLQLQQDRPDTVLGDLEKMEVLIIENFSNLYEEFLQFNSMIVSHYRYLLRIISNKQQISVTESELKNEIDSYNSQMTRLTNNLNSKLKEQFINSPDTYPNFYRYKAAVIRFWQNFFKKDCN
ncbi:TPA: hypothetical protein ACT9MC_001124 [Legionella pneumophila]|nr:hypothetical protein [Legionella pneumophila]HEN5573938.1 hypothetical protein [Legionella pneumophila]